MLTGIRVGIRSTEIRIGERSEGDNPCGVGVGERNGT